MGGTWSLNTGQNKWSRWLVPALLAVLLAGLPWETAGAAGMSLKSPAFPRGGAVPKMYTCQGGNISPPLHWSGVPSSAKSLVLIVDDPDAPDPKAPKITWVHWVLYNMPAKDGGLPPAAKSKDLPPGTEEARNGWGRTGYGGPCPPIGRHRYFFKLYALDTKLDGLTNPDKDAVVKAMQGHIVEKTELIGTYQKHP